jgi:hypothetical protein
MSEEDVGDVAVVEELPGDIVTELLEGLAWAASVREAIARRSGSRGKHKRDRRWVDALYLAVRHYVGLTARMPDAAWEQRVHREVCREAEQAWSSVEPVPNGVKAAERAKATTEHRRASLRGLALAFGFDPEEAKAEAVDWALWLEDRRGALEGAELRVLKVVKEHGRKTGKAVKAGAARYAVQCEAGAWFGSERQPVGSVERLGLLEVEEE